MQKVVELTTVACPVCYGHRGGWVAGWRGEPCPMCGDKGTIQIDKSATELVPWAKESDNA